MNIKCNRPACLACSISLNSIKNPKQERAGGSIFHPVPITITSLSLSLCIGKGSGAGCYWFNSRGNWCRNPCFHPSAQDQTVQEGGLIGKGKRHILFWNILFWKDRKERNFKRKKIKKNRGRGRGRGRGLDSTSRLPAPYHICGVVRCGMND